MWPLPVSPLQIWKSESMMFGNNNGCHSSQWRRKARKLVEMKTKIDQAFSGGILRKLSEEMSIFRSNFSSI